MPDESQIRGLENKRAEAQINHDLSSFFGLFSAEFVANNPYNKVVNREQVFEIFKKGVAGNISSFELEIEKISFVNGLAVVMGSRRSRHLVLLYMQEKQLQGALPTSG